MPSTGKDTQTFEERYKALNAEQREAVDTLAGPVMVIAGPGTGKTEVLTMRIANILRKAGGAEGGAKGGEAKGARDIAKAGQIVATGTKSPAKGTTAAAKPERILALTFTEAGAINMRKRLTELVGQEAYRVEISTFHGFANRVIRDYPDYFPHIIGGVVITEIDQVRVLRKLIDAAPLKTLKPFGDRYFYLRNIMAAIGELKRQGVTPEAFAAIATEEKKAFYENPDLINEKGKYEGKMKTKYATPAKHVERNLELAELYASYQKAILAANQYDFSDMIMYVAQALEEGADGGNDKGGAKGGKDNAKGDGGELRRVLQDAYDYFLVDEHQDTNDAQNKIIELLAGGAEAPNLFVVGDEKQAIFRFQGASLENFHYFQKKYKNVKLISLRNNYRSTQAILDAAQGVSPRAAGGELVAKAGHPEMPANLVAVSAPDVEYYFIARKIKELLEGGENGGGENGGQGGEKNGKKGTDKAGAAKTTPTKAALVKPREIAVLFRDNKDAAALARMLEKEKVPFNIESDQDVLGDEEIKKLIRILRAVERFGNDPALAEALHVDFLGIAPIDVYKLTSYAFKQKIKLYDVLRNGAHLAAAGLDEASQTAALAFFHGLSEWARAAKNRGAGDAFEAIVRESGFLAAVLNHPSATEKLAKLHALFDLLKSLIERQKNYTLDDFFTYLDLMEEHGVAIKSTETLRLADRVRLMTAHRAKGLEFDYVFVMNAVDRKWGSRFRHESIKLPAAIYKVLVMAEGALTGDEADDDADERNVFYVALTRARKEVFVTLAKTDREGKEQLPTQFIAELKENILTPYDAAPYESEFAARRGEIEFAAPAKKTPELKDKAFLNELFKTQGLSVTGLNNYLECPWQYFYRNLVRIPEAPNKNLSFGTAIHAALKSYFDAFDGGEDKGKAYLVRRFEDALTEEPIKEDDYEEALAKGRKSLPAFHDEYLAGWAAFRSTGGKAMNEVRVAEIVLEGGTMVNGKLDRIEVASGNASAAVRVVDYKTGKPKTRNDIEGNTQSSDGNYKRQLVFYKLLLDKEGKYDMGDGIVQFVEQDDKGKFHREEFPITPGEVKVLEKQIEGVAKEILDLAFWDKGCNEPECKYCELRKGMG